MEMYADIIVDISLEKLDKTFQYHIPESLRPALSVGKRVRIPFGNGNRQITGYIIKITSNPNYDPKKIKDILSIEPEAATIESKMITLASWLREQYGSTMNQALKTVLPVKTKIKEKKKKTIRLVIPKSQAEEYLQEARRRHYAGRVRLLEALLNSPDHALEYAWAASQLKVTGAMLNPLIKGGILTLDTDRIYRGPLPEYLSRQSQTRPVPNEEQQRVIEGILEEQKGRNRPCLIRGVTGSGKTLVYMELIHRELEAGRQVIVLIPEIALTYQTVQRFYDYFGNCISVLHSRLSAGERSDQMEQAREGRVQVMIGPRSALFTPFPNLGMIIIDEEHENSYKSEIMPRYHAAEVAVKRGEMEGARVVFGSATPSVQAYYRARTGEYALFTLEHRYENRSLPRVEVVDLRRELRQGNHSIISAPLEKAIRERLNRGEQVMLFLNRRGYAGFVSCRSCGYVAKCPHCDVSMTLHNNGRLVCHYCGYETAAYETCPSCTSPFIGGFKAGTQQIQGTVQKMFPSSRVLRMDFDTTRKKEGYNQILETFGKQEADILIGTQMIVKGHDFPNVTLVGVLAADLSLNDSDYRSGERTFQLLTQAVGRAGRGCVPGEAYLQTYQPEHYSIRAAVTQNYQAFYEEEMSYRSLMNYPPAAGMMAVLGGSEEEELLDAGMKYIREFIRLLDKKNVLQVIGPAPQTVSRVQDVYRRVIYVKHKNRKILTALKGKLEDYIEINSGFSNINIQFDFHL